MNTHEFTNYEDVEPENFEQYINKIIEQTTIEPEFEPEFDFEQYCNDLDTYTVSSCSSIISTTNTTTTNATTNTLTTTTEKTINSEHSIGSLDTDNTDELSEFVLNVMDSYPLKSEQMFYDKSASNDFINYTINEILINCDIPSHFLPDDFPEFIRQTIPQYKSIYDLDLTFEKVDQNLINNEEDVLKNVSLIDIQLADLRSRPQPDQRTPDWYITRMNLLSASNYYKIMGSQSSINSIIHEKCKQYNNNIPPIVVDSNVPQKNVNVNNPMHWGQKYEPMSVLLYEHEYDTQIEEFGCIQHSDHYFIGASPDGINCCQKSPLYGRMLEIKNVVSRIITGEPKKEYFAQMQVQMEVCNLNECDFLETKFYEYDNYTAFINDSSDGNVFLSNELLPPNLPLGTSHNFSHQNTKKRKGCVVYFSQPSGECFYVYMPISIKTINVLNMWIKKTIELYTSEHYNYSFVNICYWRLDVFNVVLIKRNKSWFASTLNAATKIWKTIEVERLGDYSHRAPKKRVSAVNSSSIEPRNPTLTSECVLTLSQDDKNIVSNAQRITFPDTQQSSNNNDAKYLFELFKHQTS
jgi:putative phage-type endonuclease